MLLLDRLFSLARLRWRRLVGPLPPTVVNTGGADRVFQVLDLLFVFDLYEALTNWLTPGLRRLSTREIRLLRPIFGESVPYQRIRIDERAHLGPRRYRFLYVSFHTINGWGPCSDPTLVHEVVHVWQYVHFGAIYIPRALAAQRTAAGYDYGGPSGLQAARSLEDFNYEQMADVIEDAFRLANGYPAQWIGGRTAEALPNYYRFMYDLRARVLPAAYR
ncbi:hypothetical protein [Neolewinella litorea]|uniref:DUF4157 domain-containing protein n=1 Tax=Neolewinella litorea TaxID=2562452 RepID=A0A4S4NIW1_9BACT|nr:hypothetical protein [Neolewinella litorea]THH39716.1 hypothetical protein E4021_08855 [Neolewinella litorea]